MKLLLLPKYHFWSNQQSAIFSLSVEEMWTSCPKRRGRSPSRTRRSPSRTRRSRSRQRSRTRNVAAQPLAIPVPLEQVSSLHMLWICTETQQLGTKFPLWVSWRKSALWIRLEQRRAGREQERISLLFPSTALGIGFQRICPKPLLLINQSGSIGTRNPFLILSIITNVSGCNMCEGT